MPGFAPIAVIGVQPIMSINTPDTVARHQTGLMVDGTNSWWGGCRVIYAKAGGSIRQYGLCVLTPAFNSSQGTESNPYIPGWETVATEVPNTANLGRSLAVAMAAMSSGQFGWFMLSGVTPVNCTASVAADTTFGIAAAGQGGANSAGKQVLGGRVVAAATTTVVKSGVAPANSTVLTVSNSDGWFPGVFLSGTGIATGTTVSSVSSDGRSVVLSAATTAAVNGSVTATYNNATIFYNVAHINHPIAQGAIT